MKRFLGPLLLGFFCVACGSSTPTAVVVGPTPRPTPAATRSVITVTVIPSPILATSSGDAQFPYRMDYRVTISETAGLACNVNRVVRSYQNTIAVGGSEFLLGTSNPNDLIAKVGTNHIDANGSLSIGAFGLTYGGIRQFTLTVSVEALDGNGNAVTASTTAQIQ